MKTDTTAFFANQTKQIQDDEMFFVNGFKQSADNWVQLSPFGDFDNVQGMQCLRKEDSDAIVNEFQGTLETPQRLLGLPWYVGHPDHPAFADRHTDQKAYGRIKKLETRHSATCQTCNSFISRASKTPCTDHGIFANVKWNDDGKKLIEQESFHGHSANWRMRKQPGSGNVWRPFYLKSVGFTNEPNIPVPAITAANEKNIMTFIQKIAALLGKPDLAANEESLYGEMANMKRDYDAMKGKKDACNSKIAPMLAKRAALMPFSLTLPETFADVEEMANSFVLVTDKTIEIGVKVAAETKRAETAETNFANEKGTTTRLTGELTTAKTRVTELETAQTTAANARKTERTNFAKLILDDAINLGKITAAERPALEAEFANEATFGATVGKVCGMKPKMQTQTRVGKLGERVSEQHTDSNGRMEKFVDMVNAKVDANTKAGTKSDWDTCYAQVTKENPNFWTAEAK